LQKGIQFYERFAQENTGHTELQRATAKANRRAGDLRLELQDWAGSQVDFAKAIAFFEQWANESHGTVEDQVELARSCNGMLRGLRSAGRHREAEPFCRRAIALWRKLAADKSQPSYRSELAHCLVLNLGQILSSAHQHNKAEEAVREAMQLFEGLAAEYPKVLGYRQAIGRCHFELGPVLGATGQKRQATESYKQASLTGRLESSLSARQWSMLSCGS